MRLCRDHQGNRDFGHGPAIGAKTLKMATIDDAEQRHKITLF
jgi:hypothetical protein